MTKPSAVSGEAEIIANAGLAGFCGNWILHFAGKVIHGENDTAFAVKKDGGEFDQFTGATITPRAVVNAVKRAGLYAETLPAQLNNLPSCEE